MIENKILDCYVVSCYSIPKLPIVKVKISTHKQIKVLSWRFIWTSKILFHQELLCLIVRDRGWCVNTTQHPPSCPLQHKFQFSLLWLAFKECMWQWMWWPLLYTIYWCTVFILLWQLCYILLVLYHYPVVGAGNNLYIQSYCIILTMLQPI